jgi:hypothetical protein
LELKAGEAELTAGKSPAHSPKCPQFFTFRSAVPGVRVHQLQVALTEEERQVDLSGWKDPEVEPVISEPATHCHQELWSPEVEEVEDPVLVLVEEQEEAWLASTAEQVKAPAV